MEKGTAVDLSTMTVGTYLHHWLKTCATPPQMHPTTHAGCESIIRVRLIPAIGAVPLQCLLCRCGRCTTPFGKARSDQKTGPLSELTVRLCHAILKKALKQAVRWRLVAHNVAEDVDASEAVRPHIEVWSRAEAKTFLRAVEGDIYGVIWTVALRTGMRKGELLALRWGSVDLEGAKITVRDNATALPGERHMGDPKTRSSFRTIPIPKTVSTWLGHASIQITIDNLLPELEATATTAIRRRAGAEGTRLGTTRHGTAEKPPRMRELLPR